MLLAVGILKGLAHHVGLLSEADAEQRLPLGESHVEARRAAVFRQTGEDGQVALVVVVDAHRLVVGLREVVLVDDAHRTVAVVAWHDLLGQLALRQDGLEGFLQAGTVSIKRYERGIIYESGIGAEQTGAVEAGLQLVDGHAQLGIIRQPCLLIEVQVKAPDVFWVRRQLRLFSPKQLPLTHDLHAPAADAHEGQQRLGHQPSPLTHGHSLVVARQVVHLEQHQTRVALVDALLLAVLHLRGEADARHLDGVGPSVGHTLVVLM